MNHKCDNKLYTTSWGTRIVTCPSFDNCPIPKMLETGPTRKVCQKPVYKNPTYDNIVLFGTATGLPADPQSSRLIPGECGCNFPGAYNIQSGVSQICKIQRPKLSFF